MSHYIKLLRDNQGISDLELIDKIYNHLKNDLGLKPKKAFSVIYFLQEHVSILPDTIEKCWYCKELFDSSEEGIYWESKGRHYCGCCSDQVPENYDRNVGIKKNKS